MRALYKYGAEAHATELREIPEPSIVREDDVKIAVSMTAVCGMDIHIYHGKFACTPPFVMGHEFVGTVAALGPKTEGLALGDRVVAQPHHGACGACAVCLAGAPQLCNEKRSLGISRDGAMADFVVVPSRYLHRIPSNIPDALATLIEPMTLVVDDFSRAGLKTGDTVVIIGAGQVALLAVVAVKAAGASRVIVVGVDQDIPKRLPAAKALGADYVFIAGQDDIRKEVSNLTDGNGVDMVMEASGSEEGIATAVDIVRVCGTLCLLGMTRKPGITVAWDSMMKKILNLKFNMMSDYVAIDKAIKIFANAKTNLFPLISHMVPLEDWKEVFEELTAGKGIKAVLTIGETSKGRVRE
jgi:L-iditol 2-dehydrogenase